MNIFVLDSDPAKAATYHCDKHVVKMIVESAQMLCTAHHVLDSVIDKSLLYRKTHVNHPCSVWCRQSKSNYDWLYRLFISLCDEYTKRYNKVHKTYIKFKDVLLNNPVKYDEGLTKFALAMPDHYKLDSAIKSYRLYYIKEKYKIAKWKTKKPDWYIL